MRQPKTILALCQIPECAAAKQLRSEFYSGNARLIQLSQEFLNLALLKEELLRRGVSAVDLLITRPTRGGYLSEQFLSLFSRPLRVATLSKGVEHISRADGDQLEIFSVLGAGNAPDVAELTIGLAQRFLRPIDRSVDQLKMTGEFTNGLMRNSKRLKERNWLAVGSGHQLQYLLRRLSTWELRKITIYNDSLTQEKLNRAMELYPPVEHHIVTCSSGWKLIPRNEDAPYPTIVGTTDLEPYLGQAHIVSLHMPLDNSDGPRNNYHFMNAARIRKMKKGSLLINVARGDLVDESAVVRNLPHIHYYTDVICSDAESSGNPLLSEVVTHAANGDHAGNIYITPHIGGTTQNAESAVAQEVLERAIESLALTA